MMTLSEPAYWSQRFEQLSLAGETLSEVEFDGCTFTGCDFSDAVWQRCNFVDCEFEQCNLSLLTIRYSKLSQVVFRDCKLVGIDWSKVDWPRMLFSAPMAFHQCVLNDASFYGLSLADLVMEGCRAHHVDFREADLSNGKFRATDFSHSLFHRTNLTGADFSDAESYHIDVLNNTVKHAIFSRMEAVNLLYSLDIELVD